MEAVVTQIGDKLGILFDADVIERESLKAGDRILVERNNDSREIVEMDPNSARETAREIIEANDELFRKLS